MQATEIEFANIFRRLLELEVKDCDIAICLASVPRDTLVVHFQLLAIRKNLTEEFRNVAHTCIEKYRKGLLKRTHDVRVFDIGVNPDEHEVEYINLKDLRYTIVKEKIAPLAQYDNDNIFQEDKHFTKDLRFYVIIAQPPQGEPYYFYRYYTSKKTLKESQNFLARLVNDTHEYTSFDEPAFLFDSHIDCLSHKNDLFIFQKNNFYAIFDFLEELQKKADETLKIIEACNLISNFEEFAKSCRGDRNKILSLKNISMQPYLNILTVDALAVFIKEQALPIEIKRDGTIKKLYYDPKEPWELLKLLNDAHLHSKLTGENYETNSKRKRKRK